MILSFFLIAGWLIWGIWMIALIPNLPLLWTHRLRRQAQDRAMPSEWPLVSVIVPARNEGEKIEASLRSLLQSDYPHLEVIGIDDRSEDETGPCMDRLAEEDSRLRVIHVKDLHENWLGKNQALHIGAQEAQGEYLLFTDGDVMFRPEALRMAIRRTVSERVDHLCLIPRMISGSYLENALVTFFGLMLMMGLQLWLVSSRFPFFYVGVGAFNLIKKQTYWEFGGHEPIRLDVLDDIKLGKLVKRSGGKQELLFAEELVQVKWQESAWGVLRGLEKNAFASLNYSLTLLCFSTVMFIVLLIVPYVGVLFFPEIYSWGYVASLLIMHGSFGLLGSVFGGGVWVWPALPLAGVSLLFAFWRSAVLTLSRGGIAWRDTFYSLERLQKNLY